MDTLNKNISIIEGILATIHGNYSIEHGIGHNYNKAIDELENYLGKDLSDFKINEDSFGERTEYHEEGNYVTGENTWKAERFEKYINGKEFSSKIIGLLKYLRDDSMSQNKKIGYTLPK